MTHGADVTEAVPAGKGFSADGRDLPVGAFIGIVVGYLVLLKAIGIGMLFAGDVDDGRFLTIRQVVLGLVVPIGATLVYALVVAGLLGWWRPVFRDDRPVRRWVWIVPITFALAIAAGINYGELADKGIGFTLALLLGTQCVGWAEETMFRGIGVTTFRRNGYSEHRVALWSSIVFGLVHLSNLLGGGAGAIGQAVIVSFAGYFFYLVRRVSHSNAVNSILHGLFDFMILTGTAIIPVGEPAYSGVAVAVLVYLVLGIVLLIRRHHIELPPVLAPAA